MKFLHAADIHLDSPLTGLSSRGTVPEHVIRHCTRRAFANLIDLAVTQDVAFVIIAGDLYDADWRDYSTGLFFAGEMRRLQRPCFLVRGNHDARSVITRTLERPPNVQELSDRKPETIMLDAQGVAIHGQSYSNRTAREDLSADYPARVTGRLNIGVLHTSAEDPGEHETYAPCSLRSLALKGYDYWALGHVHARQVLHQHQPWIVFPGNTQGRSVRETGPKGCTLVDVQDGRVTGIEHRSTDVVRWAVVRVAIDGADDMADVSRSLRLELTVARDLAAGMPLIARLVLHGATDFHAAMAADFQAVEAECRNAAAAVSGDLYIERVRIETRMAAASNLLTGAAALQLEEAFSQALEDREVQQRLLAEFSALAGQIPAVPGRDARRPPTTLEELRALAPDAWHMIAQALTGGDHS